MLIVPKNDCTEYENKLERFKEQGKANGFLLCFPEITQVVNSERQEYIFIIRKDNCRDTAL